MLKALYIMDPDLSKKVYQETTQANIKQIADIIGPILSKEDINKEENQDLLKEVDVIFSGWGAPVFDKDFLDRTPNLKVIFYGAGTMKSLLTDEVWKRGIRVTTASIANSIPVGEFTLALILLSLKNTWQLSRKVKEDKTFVNGIFLPASGIYNSTVGIISFSSIGQGVINHLENFNVDIVLYDPYVSKDTAERFGARLVSLEELFQISNVVSLHSPLLPETVGMITAEHFKSMKENATFINTARGAIIREDDLIEVLKKRNDLTAVLDVTHPEPPAEDSELYTLDNVILTPHIAGSIGNEIGRLGEYMYEEAREYVEKQILEFEITKESYERMA